MFGALPAQQQRGAAHLLRSAAPPARWPSPGRCAGRGASCSPRPDTGRRGGPREPCAPAAGDPHSYRRPSPRSHPPAAAPGKRGLLWARPPSPAMQCPNSPQRSAAAIKHRPPHGRMRGGAPGPCRSSGSGRPAAKGSRPRPTAGPHTSLLPPAAEPSPEEDKRRKTQARQISNSCINTKSSRHTQVKDMKTPRGLYGRSAASCEQRRPRPRAGGEYLRCVRGGRGTPQLTLRVVQRRGSAVQNPGRRRWGSTQRSIPLLGPAPSLRPGGETPARLPLLAGHLQYSNSSEAQAGGR